MEIVKHTHSLIRSGESLAYIEINPTDRYDTSVASHLLMFQYPNRSKSCSLDVTLALPEDRGTVNQTQLHTTS
jgi:hypothetical protein